MNKVFHSWFNIGMFLQFLILFLLTGVELNAQKVHLCGSERWAVKTLQDGFEIPDHAVVTTVSALRKLPKPATLPQTRLKVETVEILVDVDVPEFKVEDDKDLHVVAYDHGGDSKQTMIFEIPAPNCAADLLRQILIQVREDFIRAVNHKLPASSGQMVHLPKPAHMQFTAIVFYDKIHGQTGVAPNGIEGHPVLQIKKIG